MKKSKNHYPSEDFFENFAVHRSAFFKDMRFEQKALLIFANLVVLD